jgi:putative ABC transport system permease protein
MLRNYFITALRNLWKYRFYSAINTIGLAIGLGCFLFILLFVQDEVGYDQYHEKAGQIYRINFDGYAFDQKLNFAVVGAQVGPVIKAEWPEIEQYCRFRQRGSFTVSYNNQSFREQDWIFADSTLFDVFSFELVKGDPQKVLAEPNTLVITEAQAEKYFGAADPIGKSLRVDNNSMYRVTGVMKEIPRQSHFRFDMIASMATINESRDPSWLSNNFQTYVVLKEGVDAKLIDEKFKTLVPTYMGPELEQFMGKTWDDIMAEGNFIDFTLFPMTKIHLYSQQQVELGANGDIKYVYIFTFIGIFILLLACVNFINLATARSATRSREVGMRKVVGASRPQLIMQFLSESLVITFLSLIIAAVLLVFLLPYFNDLSGKQFLLSDVLTVELFALMFGLIVIVGLIAGSYPALHLSRFTPLKAIRSGGIKGAGRKLSLRSVLVVFQFAITISLIVGTLIISKQLSYIQNKKLGYDKDQVIILNNFYNLGNNCLPFKEEIKKHPQVVNATISGTLPTPSSSNNSAVFLGRNPDPSKTHVLRLYTVDHDYIPTLSMEMAEGRAFSRDFSSDSNAVIINEAAVKLFGLDNPLETEISTFAGGSTENPQLRVDKIIGVVKNFHFESLRSQIGPLAMYLGEHTGNLSIKVKTENWSQFIGDLNRLWNQMGPGQPFDYDFMEEDFNSMYESESRIGSIFSVFTFLAIVIACLGLFGLATFTAEQRTREMGIRKVVGASVSRIFYTLTIEVIQWVLIANLIALPVAYYFMSRWLEGFAYPVSMSWGTFAGALLIGLAVAVITISYQALRVSVINPAKALRHE